VLESHGLFTWADTSKQCYDTTISVINKAVAWFGKNNEEIKPFGGAKYKSLPTADRRAIAAQLMPDIRGFVSDKHRMVGHFNDSDAVLEFVNSNKMEPLAALGTSCPDHFLRTKIRPLVLSFDPGAKNVDEVIGNLPKQIADYRRDYAAYYDRCKHKDSANLRDPNAVVYLVPGVRMITFAKDKTTARISGEFHVNAINVIREASSASDYMGLPEQDAFDIEYWLLEEAKLQRLPKPKSLAGRVALITGGGGGIGMATAERFLTEGACVMLADINSDSLKTAENTLINKFGKDQIRSIVMDVTDEVSVGNALAEISVEFGGIELNTELPSLSEEYEPPEFEQLLQDNSGIDYISHQLNTSLESLTPEAPSVIDIDDRDKHLVAKMNKIIERDHSIAADILTDLDIKFDLYNHKPLFTVEDTKKLRKNY